MATQKSQNLFHKISSPINLFNGTPDNVSILELLPKAKVIHNNESSDPDLAWYRVNSQLYEYTRCLMETLELSFTIEL